MDRTSRHDIQIRSLPTSETRRGVYGSYLCKTVTLSGNLHGKSKVPYPSELRQAAVNSLVDINLAAPGCLGLCYWVESCPRREVRPPIDLSRLAFERMDL